jgi:hypothetical protein
MLLGIFGIGRWEMIILLVLGMVCLVLVTSIVAFVAKR